MINEFKSKTTTTICHNQSTEMVPFTVASPPRMLSRTGLAILCGGVDENDPHRLSGQLVPSWWCCLGRWCGLSGGSICHWGWALRVSSLVPLPVHSLCFLFTVEDISTQLPAPAPLSANCCHASPPRWTLLPLESYKQNKLSYKLLLAMAFYCSNRKVTHKAHAQRQ